MPFITPEVFSNLFTCPFCGAIAKQDWWSVSFHAQHHGNTDLTPLRVGTCQHCQKSTIWVIEKMYFPDSGNTQFPNPEMPETVKKIYLEAGSIHSKSPRGAAALLRLGIQVLCKELGEPGKNINDDIASLVKKGLPELVQKSLDIVRVTGNESVHPGQIDTDDPETVIRLFDLTNIIVEYMIALPKMVSGIYAGLPAEKVAAIEKRDKK